MNKKKILYLVTQSEWGGAQKYIYDLATHLAQDNFEIAVASGSSKSETLIHRLQKNNIKIHPLNYLRRRLNPCYDFLALIELYQLFKKTRPDIIHLNSSKAGVLGSIAGRLAGVKKIFYTVHGWVFNEPLPKWKKTFYLMAEKITARLKTKIICVSEHDRQIALEYNIKPEKLITIHNGINADTLDFYNKETARELLAETIGYKLDCHSNIVGTIANPYKTKGLDFLLAGARQLPQHIFIIIGEGPEQKNLETYVAKYNLGKRVFLTGTIKEAYRYLKAFDVFILPSIKEGCPYSILEALAARLPIVATKVGALSEILSAEHLIEPGNVQAIVEKIKNPPLIREIDINTISLDKMLAKTKNIYNS